MTLSNLYKKHDAHELASAILDVVQSATPAAAVVIELARNTNGADQNLTSVLSQIANEADAHAHEHRPDVLELLATAIRTNVRSVLADNSELPLREKCKLSHDAVQTVVDTLRVGRSQAAQAILGAVTELSDHVRVVGPLLQALYESDRVTEDEILAWHRIMVMAGNEVASSKFVMQFVNWLQTAASESEESEDD